MEPNDKTICTECGTENESKYLYCKNCGHRLHEEETGTQPHTAANGYFHHDRRNETAYNDYFSHENQHNTAENDIPNPMSYSQSDYTETSNQGSYFQNNPIHVEQIQGLSAEEISAFIGQAAPKIMPKFEKMEITGKKISWCWPAAILGYLLGPLGAALWFFYRKMYKIAFALVGIGAVCLIATGLLSSDTSPQFDSFMKDFLNQNGALTVSLSEFFRSLVSQMSKPENILSYLGGAIENVSRIATCVFTGLFGYHWYRCHAVRSILSYRQSCTDPRYYQIGLLAVGGTSGGMLTLGIALYLILANAVSVVAYLVH